MRSLFDVVINTNQSCSQDDYLTEAQSLETLLLDYLNTEHDNYIKGLDDDSEVEIEYMIFFDGTLTAKLIVDVKSYNKSNLQVGGLKTVCQQLYKDATVTKRKRKPTVEEE